MPSSVNTSHLTWSLLRTLFCLEWGIIGALSSETFFLHYWSLTPKPSHTMKCTCSNNGANQPTLMTSNWQISWPKATATDDDLDSRSDSTQKQLELHSMLTNLHDEGKVWTIGKHSASTSKESSSAVFFHQAKVPIWRCDACTLGVPEPACDFDSMTSDWVQ